MKGAAGGAALAWSAGANATVTEYYVDEAWSYVSSEVSYWCFALQVRRATERARSGTYAAGLDLMTTAFNLPEGDDRRDSYVYVAKQCFS